MKSAYVYCRGGDTLAWYLTQVPKGSNVDEVLRAKLDGPYRIESGHCPMITKPEDLAQALLSLPG